jgi:hypothetical protein
MQNSGIRYKEFLPPVSKPLALYFMQRKTAVISHNHNLRLRIAGICATIQIPVGASVEECQYLNL